MRQSVLISFKLYARLSGQGFPFLCKALGPLRCFAAPASLSNIRIPASRCAGSFMLISVSVPDIRPFGHAGMPARPSIGTGLYTLTSQP